MAIDVEKAFVSKLLNTAGISSLVSTRIHPLRLPDRTVLPAISYQLISKPPVSTHDESSVTLSKARYQFTSWSGSYAGAVALAEAIFSAMHGFDGLITVGADSMSLHGCLEIDRRYDNDSESGVYWAIQDFTIWY